MTTPSAILDPDTRPTGNPVAALWRNRALLRRFLFNDALGRYRDSVLGLCWSFLNPLLLLAVFTVAFGALWGNNPWFEGLPIVPVVLPIFCGMMVFGVFSEILSRSPVAIVSHPNFVKKVVFPLEILPASMLGSALVHASLSLLILVIGQLALGYGIHWQVILVPIILTPLILLTLGLGYFLASLGVYVRDIAHSIGVITQVFFFLSPIVYPASQIKSPMASTILDLNPLTTVIESTRLAIIWGQQPDWTGIGIMTIVGTLVAWAGFVWFQRTRGGFADVL